MIERDPVKVDDLNYVPMDAALGRRISVVGNGGKTTLAKSLVAKTGFAFIELDALHWKANWVESTPEAMTEKVTAAIEATVEGWIIDGSYWSKIDGLVLQQADMIIWLDLSWRVMFWRMLKRSFQRAWDKNKICGDNTEGWRKLFSTDSLWWYWITHRKTYLERGVRMAELLPRSTPVIRLRTAGELNRFYEVQGLTRGSGK